MKKTLFLSVAMLCASFSAFAGQTPAADADTSMQVLLEDVEVLGTRATATTPVTYSNVGKQQIAEVNHGRDIPFLLTTTPSVVATSDAGNGIGYSSIRIRGVDPTRINITANDIPMNDAESHEIFWVNTPDFATSLQDIQVQRGVGTSSNGAGAFGANINLRTQRMSSTPFAEVSGSYGSFNTNKESVKAGTGLLGGHWIFDGRFSHIASEGYRDRASSKLHSYFVQAGYFYDAGSVRFVNFGGKEQTYHAWDGISRDKLNTDRTYNPNGAIKHDDKITGFYKDQLDIYRQTHYQLIWEHNFNPRWHLNLAAHYTDGYGYYQEYKNARTLKEYALVPFELNGETIKKSSLVRRKVLDSGFGGIVYSLRFDHPAHHTFTFGGSVNRYGNDHYGRVLWVENYLGQLNPDHEYYRNKGKKTDVNFYLKGDMKIWRGLRGYLDLQFRHIAYTIKGENDKWDWTATPEHLQILDVDEKFNFFNPKAGLYYQINPNHSAYASFAVAHKEPTRNNYNDGPLLVHPKAERLFDYELGYNFRNSRFNAGINFYYMKYKDQLVLNGKLNEIGEAMAENVPDSYRMGVELTAGAKITDWLMWDVNATFSRNRIKDYVGYVSDYDENWEELWTQTAIKKGNTTIAMSPSIIVGSNLQFALKGFSAQLQSQYVGRQYLDNFESKEDSLDPYFVTNLNLAYTFKFRLVKALTLGCTIYNLFNEKYENNGYSQTAAVYGADGKMTLVSDPRFYPMAGTNVLAHITLSF